MEIKAVACELPNPDRFMVFHSHVQEDKAIWLDTDRDRFFALKDLIDTIYRDPAAARKLSRADREALIVEGLNAEDAKQRLAPRLVDANRFSKGTTYLSRHTDYATVVEPIGMSGAHGIRFVVIVKRAVGLRPTPLFLRLYSSVANWRARNQTGDFVSPEFYQPGMDLVAGKQTVDLDSLEFRTSPALIELVRRNLDKELVEEGHLKIVSMPLSAPVRLMSDGQSEFVQAEPQRWR